MNPDLTVVLLCHNERENLPDLLDRVEDTLSRLDGESEVVVVNDGSTDDSVEWLAERRHKVPTEVVSHPQRMGYGAALRSGLGAATGNRVVYMDGDGQFDPAQIPEFLDAMDAESADLVIGERVDRADNLYRRAVGNSYNWFARQCLKQTAQDLDCGFKLLTRSVVDTIELRSDGNLVSAELLAKAARAGFSLKQLPVRHTPRQHGKSKGVDMAAVVLTLKELFTLWKEIRG